MRPFYACLALALTAQLILAHGNGRGRGGGRGRGKGQHKHPRRMCNRTEVARRAKNIWPEWKRKHDRHFSRGDDAAHLAHFIERNQIVEQHNMDYDDGLVSFQAEINQFSDMSPEERAGQLMGYVAAEMEEQGGRSKRNVFSILPYPVSDDRPLPSSIDWRTRGAVTPVKNQSPCGACWAFAAVAAIEGQWAIHKQSSRVFSERELIDCALPAPHCGVGYSFESAFMYSIRNCTGLSEERHYPSTLMTKEACKPRVSGVRVKDFVSMPDGDENALMHAVATVGPIATSMFIYQQAYTSSYADMFDYKKGMFYDENCAGRQGTNHAVTVVGYDSSEEDGDYWIVKNSWGTAWGEGGYMRIPRGQAHCNFGERSAYPILA